MAGEEKRAGRRVPTIVVRISDDELTCTVDIPAARAGGPRVLLGNLLKALLDAGVERSRIDDDVLADGLRQARESKSARIGVVAARGLAPKQASGWRVRATGLLESGCVMPGDRIAEIVAERPMSDGMTVKGEVIPATPDPKQPRLVSRANVVLSPKGDYAVAQIYGQAEIEGFEVLVKPGMHVSKDQLTCRMSFFPAHIDGRAISRKDIHQLLHTAGILPEFVLEDTLTETINKLWNQGSPLFRVVVAKGRPATRSIDGYIEMSTKTSDTAVFPGEWTARRVAPIPAVEGLTLLGELIEVDSTPREAELEAGEGVRYDPEDDDLLISTQYGCARLERCRVSISTALRIAPDSLMVQMDVYPRRGTGQPVQFDELYQLLLDQGIAEDTLQLETLRLALADAKKDDCPIEDVQVASAIEPHAGSGGRVVIHPPQGTLVFAGDCIGNLEGEEPPRPGVDVLGNLLQSDSPPTPPLHAGFGVQFNREDRSLFAVSTGLLRLEGELIDLQPVVEISENRLEAWIDLPLLKVDGNTASVEETIAVAIEAGIDESLVIEQAILDVLDGRDGSHPRKRVRIALGRSAVDGIPASPLPASHLQTGCLLPGDIAVSPGEGANPEPGCSVLGDTLHPNKPPAQTGLRCEGIGHVDEKGCVVIGTYGFARLENHTVLIEPGIRFSEDGLHCTMDIHHRRADGMELETGDLVEALVACGVVRERVDSEAISQALERSIEQDAPEPGVLVGKGIPPRPSEDWSVQVPDEISTRCVMPGDTVAWLQAAIHAKSGVGVRGEKILAPPTQGRPKLRIGRNCELESRGNVVTAKVYGRIVDDDGCFSVLSALRISEDNVTAQMDLFGHRVDGSQVTIREIVAFLLTRGIQQRFIRQREIKSALEAARSGSRVVDEVLVAMAKPVNPGADGRIEPTSDPMLGCVMPGDVAARALDSVAATDGEDLFGNPLLANSEPEETSIVAGDGCRLDGKRVLAEQYGQVRIEGEEVRIRPGLETDREGKQLRMDIFPVRTGGTPVSPSNLLRMLSQLGVKREHIDTGAIEDALEKALASRRPSTRVVVARSIPPEPGQPGHVELIGAITGSCALPGDRIAHLLDSSPPKPGRSFKGEEIEAPEESLGPLFTCGEHANLDKTGLRATALVYGLPVLKGRHIDVLPGVRISDDELSCEMDVFSSRVTGKSPSTEALFNILRQAGIQSDRIDRNALQTAVSDLASSKIQQKKTLVVARGISPVGNDLGFPVALGDLENGCLLAGDPIAEFTEPKSESRGLSVTGKPLVSQEKAEEGGFLIRGPANLEEDGRRARAREYGFATLVGRELHIQSGVHITSDGMRCLVDISPLRADAAPLTIDDLLTALRSAGLADDIIDSKALQKGLRKAQKTGEIQLGVEVASGRPPTEAQDWCVETIGNLEDSAVLPGDAILRRRSASSEKPGLTVRGERIDAPTPKERPRLQAGTGTKRSPRGNTVFATIYGTPEIDGNACRVKPGIRISTDGLTCVMDFFPRRTNRAATPARIIITMLQDLGILSEFILHDAIESALERAKETGQWQEAVVVATGRPPLEGQTGQPALITTEPNRCAMAGDIIARLQKPRPPTPGMTVLGEDIPIEQELETGIIETGEFTRFSENEEGAIVAQVMGLPTRDGSRIDIKPAVDIAESLRVAHMDVYPYGIDGSPVSNTDLISGLTAEGVLLGRIDTEGVSLARRQAQEEDAVVERALVAFSIEPMPSTPGRLEVVEDIQGICAFAGDLLARIVDVEDAEPGIGVTGEEIFAEDEGIELRLEIGDGCELSEDERSIFATGYGQIRHMGIALSLKPPLALEEEGAVARLDVLSTRIGDRRVGAEELIDFLKANGLVEHLIDVEAIRQALEIADEIPQVGVVVARCKPSLDGVRGEIVQAGELVNRALFNGDPVLRLQGNQAPQTGLSVTGTKYPPLDPITPINLSASGFCAIDTGKQTITATAYGTAVAREGHVDFNPGIQISNNGLEVRMDIYTKQVDGEEVTVQQLLAALLESGVMENTIDPTALADGLDLARRQGAHARVLVARGVPPKATSSWKIETVGELENACVLPGDQLLRRFLNDEREAGLSVTGEVIQPPRHDRGPSLLAGDGCREVGRRGIITSSIYGEAICERNAVRVVPGLRISESATECHMDIFPQRSSGKPTSRRLLEAILEQAGIHSDFMDTDAIVEALERAHETQSIQRNILVAVARLPDPGKDGWVQIATEDTCAAVVPGDPVARLMEPVAPSEGTNLEGKPIPTTNEVFPGEMKAGLFVEVNSNNSDQLNATVYGQPFVDGIRGDVRPGIQIDAARLKCELDIYPRRIDGEPITLELLHKILSDNDVPASLVQVDLLEEALERALDTGVPVRGVRVAQATRPKQGTPGHLDFEGEGVLGVAMPGELVARRVGVIEPLPGLNVTGGVIPAPEMPESPADSIDGCRFDEDQYAFMALEYGSVHSDGPKLRLVPGIRISPDKLSCDVDIHAFRCDGRPVSVADVVAQLQKLKISHHTIDEDAIRVALETSKKTGSLQADVLVATGKAGVPHFIGALRATGSLDMTVVLPGDVLLEREPETVGKEGLTVLGEPIPIPKTESFTAWTTEGSCCLSEDKNSIVATGYGLVRISEETILVEPGVHILDDSMRCTMDLATNHFQGKNLDCNDIEKALIESGIAPASIDRKAIERGLRSVGVSDDVIVGLQVAKGRLPVSSSGLKLVPSGEFKGRFVLSGDLVLKLVASQPAKAGFTVTGERLVGTGESVRPKLHAGPGCNVSSNKQAAIAMEYGEIYIRDSTIGVKPGVRISGDKMTCHVDVYPCHFTGRAITEAIVLDALAKTGLSTESMDLETLRDVINECWNSRQTQQNVLIASGTYPQPPENGRIVPAGDPQVTGFYADEIVATVLDPVVGRPGITLFGIEIPVEGEGRAVQLDAGKNCRIDEEGRGVAEVYGRLKLDGRVMKILPGLRFDELGYECKMDIFPFRKGGKPTTIKNIISVLKRAGVTPDRINTHVLETALEQSQNAEEPVLDVVAALPMHPMPGEEGQVVSVGDPNKTIAFTGDVVAHLEGRNEPFPGINVMGEEIPPPAEAYPPRLEPGERCTVSEDGLRATAECYGQLVITGMSLEIIPGIRIAADGGVCHMDISPTRPDGSPITLEDLVKVLRTEGIDEDCIEKGAIEQALRAITTGLNPDQKDVCVARQVSPTDGRSGTIKAIGDLDGGCVLPGDVFLRISGSLAPEPGKTVRGEPIAPHAHPEEPKLEAGEFCEVVSEGKELASKTYGRGVIEEGRATVRQGFKVSPDKMRCLVELVEKKFDGSLLQSSEVVDALIKAGIDSTSIDRTGIEETLLTCKDSPVRCWAASGVSTVEGTHAQMEALPNLKTGSVTAGEDLVQISAPIFGQPGRNVFGEVIQPKLRLRNLEFDQPDYAELSSDKLQIHARVYGGVSISVSDTTEHPKGPIHSTLKMAVSVEPGIHLPKDEMTCTMDIYPSCASGLPTTIESLVELLKGIGVVESTIDHKAIAEAIAEAQEQGKRGERVLVANAQMPVHGDDGRLIFLSFEGPDHLNSRTRGIGPIHVSRGDHILVVEPPTKGQDGLTVTGQSIPAFDGEPASLIVGSGIDMRGHTAKANRDGVLLFHGNLIDVVGLTILDSHLEAPKRISTGSIEIRGAVLPGTRLVVPGDVYVHGDVNNADITAGGSILTQGHVAGSTLKTTVLRAGGIIRVTSSTEAELIAKGDVFVQESATSTKINAGGTLWMTADPGALIGGESQAMGGAVVRTLGHRDQVPTILEVGGENQEIRRLRTELERQRLALEFPDDPSADTTDLAALCAGLEHRLAAATERDKQRPPRLIIVGDAAHPGVTISIDGATKGISKDPFGPGCFYVEHTDYEILFTTLQELGDETSLEDYYQVASDHIRQLRASASAAAESKSSLDEEASQSEVVVETDPSD